MDVRIKINVLHLIFCETSWLKSICNMTFTFDLKDQGQIFPMADYVDSSCQN